jgi:hypothetical protein
MTDDAMVLASKELEELAAKWDREADEHDGGFTDGLRSCAEDAREAAASLLRVATVDVDTGAIRVTAVDLKTGEAGQRVIHNDVCVITAGTCHISSVADYPKSGTQVYTIKGRHGRGGRR